MASKDTSILHTFTKSNSLFSPFALIILLIAVILGIGGGYVLSQGKTTMGTVSTSGQQTSGSSITKGTVVGTNDTSTFKDTAEGVLQVGGIKDEGQFHLVRPGGPDQYVYMTSSIVDLSQFVGKKVKVNGQTQKAQYAGWLMDVGRVEVIE